jgi:hypothetical protein
MMKGFVFYIIVVTALFFYLNTNSEIDATEGQRTGPQEKESAVLHVKEDMPAAKVVAQVATTPLIEEEFDMVVPSTSPPVSSWSDLSGGIDEIGGYYDVNARSPEFDSQQYNEVTSIGIDTSDILVPEMDFDYINIEGEPPSINKGKHQANSQGY